LGWKVFETPLMIGVNWILLTYATVYSLEKYIQTKWILALFSSFVLVTLDFLIEPIAITYDFWTWTNGQIPIQNYVAWYVVGVVFCFALAQFKKDSFNTFAPFLLLIQFLFFGILNFV
jgi:putative membrane protein